MLQIAVLGPVEVRRDGRLVPVPGGKTAELLVRLALEPGLVVRADRLVDELWAGAPTNRNTLQAKVARLRRALADPSAIAGGDGGYRLAVEPDAVDALRVLRDVATAAERLDAARCSRRRRAERGGAGAVPRGRAPVDGRLGRAAPGTARRRAREARRDPALGPAATRGRT